MFLNLLIKPKVLFDNKRNRLALIVILLVFVSCARNKKTEPILKDSINFNHFNHLYKEIDFKDTKVGIVHIYSQYPNYEYAIEPKEGFTCVDDVARAIVMLSMYLKEN